MTPASSSILSQIALGVAILLFIGVIAWLWLTPNAQWRRAAELPLEEKES